VQTACSCTAPAPAASVCAHHAAVATCLPKAWLRLGSSNPRGPEGYLETEEVYVFQLLQLLVCTLLLPVLLYLGVRGRGLHCALLRPWLLAALTLLFSCQGHLLTACSQCPLLWDLGWCAKDGWGRSFLLLFLHLLWWGEQNRPSPVERHGGLGLPRMIGNLTHCVIPLPVSAGPGIQQGHWKGTVEVVDIETRFRNCGT
jgi:hypothetical protein